MKIPLTVRMTAVILILICLLNACEKIIPKAPADDELLDGPVDGLTTEQQRQFLAGDVAFNDDIFTAEKGLGPVFVATSCGSCHAGDGKGHPFTTLTRFGQTDNTGNHFLDQGGPQLQNRALPGYMPEQIPAGATFSRFTPPANTGLGFLAALTDAQILANADPEDTDGDGISGVPNYIVPPGYFQPQWFHQSFNGRYIGRFGKKAAAIDLLQQTVNAYNQDIGITSAFDPIDAYSHREIDPEISTQTVQHVVFYLRTLKAPVPRNQTNPDVQHGRQVFNTIGCAKCHIPEITTPPSDIAALSNVTVQAYTDLLLHDMGSGLDDGYTEGSAKTSEWRTPPLWGLGLAPKSQGREYFLLHDGRASGIGQAIQLHGGEAAKSSTAYQQLGEKDRNDLIKFLQSL